MNDGISQRSGARTRISQIDANPPIADAMEGNMSQFEEFEPVAISDADIETQRAAEVAEVLERVGVTPGQIVAGTDRIEPTVQSPTVNAVLDNFYATEQPTAETASLPPAKPASDLFNQVADISRTAAYAATGNEDFLKTPTEPKHETFLVPYNGGAGVEMLDLFRPTVLEYGKTLSKEEVGRITAEFKEALQLPTALDTELSLITAKDESLITAEDSARAGELRQAFKKIRVGIEHRRKFLKERALRTGQMIDGLANVGKEYCSTRESRAEAIEKIEERRIKAAQEQLAATRLAELTPFLVPDTPLTFDLGKMPEDQYQILLDGSKAAAEKREQLARDAEIMRESLEREQKFEAEKAAKKLTRINQLSELGFTFNAPSREYGFAQGHFCIEERTIEALSDVEWLELFAKTEADVVEFKRRAQAELDAEAARQREAAERAAIDRENARIAQERLDKIEAEKAEKEREAAALAVAPDVEKLEAYFKAVQDAVASRPELATATGKVLLDRFFGEVSGVVNRYVGEATTI